MESALYIACIHVRLSDPAERLCMQNATLAVIERRERPRTLV